MLLKGQGVWVAFHQAALSVSGHTWVNLCDKLVDHGITTLLPRAGGTHRDPGWDPYIAGQVTRIAHERGLKVVPWWYSVPSTWKEQIDLAGKLMQDGVDGLVVDAELEFEGNHQDEAFQLGEGLRKELGDQVLIAHAPLPYINYHLSYPYATFAGFCDMVMPQTYWNYRPGGWADMDHGMTHQWTDLIANGSPIAKGFAPIGVTYGNDSSYPQGCQVPFRYDDIAQFDRRFTELEFRSYYSVEAASPKFWGYLKPDLNTDIGRQIALWKTGFYSGSIDGKFGPVSKAATAAFQASQGLTPDQIFGPKTTEAMQNVLKVVAV